MVLPVNTNSWIDPDTGVNNWINPDLGGGSGGFNMDALQNILGLVGQGYTTANTFKGYQPTAAEGAQNQALANAQELLKMYLNPNSPVFKNLNAANEESLNTETQKGLSDLLQRNRKAQLMGRATYFNPERQDESISRYLSNRATENANTARSNALQQIVNAANSYRGIAGTYGSMIPQQQQAQTQNREAAPAGLNQITQMLPQLATMAMMFL